MNLNRCIHRPIKPIEIHQRTAFDQLLEHVLGNGRNAPINYTLPFPKSEFLNYLCDEKGYFAHGSNAKDLQMLEPIRHSSDVSEFGNRQQIFASGDGTWAIWFAILDKERSGGTSNGCFTLETGEGTKDRFSYFAVTATALKKSPPFCSGTVYIVPAKSFPHTHELPFDPPLSHTSAQFEEYGSDTPVEPLAHLHVEPEDFPYLNQVYGYEPQKLTERLQNDMENIPWLDDGEVYPIRPEK